MTETILVEQAQLQPQEELEVELVKAPEDLQDAPVNFWPWTNEEQNTALLTEKSSGHEVPKKNVIQPNPIDLDTTATAQDTKYPLPVAPSVDQVYILLHLHHSPHLQQNQNQQHLLPKVSPTHLCMPCRILED